jgi:hypothetical protein
MGLAPWLNDAVEACHRCAPGDCNALSSWVVACSIGCIELTLACDLLGSAQSHEQAERSLDPIPVPTTPAGR